MNQPCIPDTPNVSLIAFYGKKNPALESLICQLQQRLITLSAGSFQEYPLAQIHATLIGCEGMLTAEGIVSKWFWENRQQVRSLDLAGFLGEMQKSDRIYIPIRIGGYNLKTDYGFTSRNQHPFYRSFQFHGAIAVFMGWPYRNQQFPADLDDFRRHAQRYNLLHKFHRHPETIDNDCYLRLGTLTQPLSAPQISEIEEQMREFLATLPPLEVAIAPDNLAFAGYQELSLPVQTTQVIPLSVATPSNLIRLYPESKSPIESY